MANRTKSSTRPGRGKHLQRPDRKTGPAAGPRVTPRRLPPPDPARMKRSLGHANTAAEFLLLRLRGLQDHLRKAGDHAALVTTLTTATDLREWLRLAEEVTA